MALDIIGMGARYGPCSSLHAFEQAIYSGKRCPCAAPINPALAALDAWQDVKGATPNRVGLILHESFDLKTIQDTLPEQTFLISTIAERKGAVFTALESADDWLAKHPSDMVLIALGDETGAGSILLKGSSSPMSHPAYGSIVSINMGAKPSGVMKRSLDLAGISPALLGTLECLEGFEGEGLSIVEDLASIYPKRDEEPPTALGSVTPTVRDSTGMAGSIKAVLALHRRTLYGIRIKEDNTLSSLNGTPFYVPPRSRPWLEDHEKLGRMATVCGYSGPFDEFGTLVIEESRQRRKLPKVRPHLTGNQSYLLPFSGEDQHTLHQDLEELQTQLENHTSLTAAAQKAHAKLHEEKAPLLGSLVGRRRNDLLEEIQRAKAGINKAFATGMVWRTPRGSYFTPNPLGDHGIAFVYPGAFNSYPGMGRELFSTFPYLHEGIQPFTPDISHSLAERFLYLRSIIPLSKEEQRAHAQRFLDHPVELIESGISLSILHTLILKEIFRISPSAAFGYSLGEISMLWANDVWQNSSQSSLAWQQSPLFKRLLYGPKEAVRSYWGKEGAAFEDNFWGSYILKAPVENVQAAIRGQKEVFLTIINAPGEVVIAGLDEACQGIIQELNCHALPMPFDAVIHNPAMGSTYDDFVTLYTNEVKSGSEIKFYSAAQYEPLIPETDRLAQAIAKMTCEQVDFPGLVNAVYRDGARIFIEVGPQKTCSRWIDKILQDSPHAVIAVNKKYQPDYEGVIKVLSLLLSHKVQMDLSPIYASPDSGSAEYKSIKPTRRKVQVQAPVNPKEESRTTADLEGTEPASVIERERKQKEVIIDTKHYALSYQSLNRQASRVAESHRFFLVEQQKSLRQMNRLWQMKLSLVGEKPSLISPSPAPMFREEEIRALTLGDPQECFGPSYAVYDGRRVPRLPNGEFRFIDRVMNIHGKKGIAEPGSSLVSEVDIPDRAWFFQGPGSKLPYVCLLEIALQPCGFLSAYLGSTLHQPETDFYFRNLDGEGSLSSWPSLRGKNITNRVELLSTHALQEAIIQAYSFRLASGGVPFYEGETSFGYFTRQALSDQVGLDQGQLTPPWKTLHPSVGSWFSTNSNHGSHSSKQSARLPEVPKVWIAPQGGKHSQGYLYTEEPISPDAWYFDAHFYQDPVMPGSLGIELMARAIRASSTALGLPKHLVWRVKPNQKTSWKYRGQVTQRDRRIQIEVHLKNIYEDEGRMFVIAEGSLWNDSLRIYHVDGLALEAIAYD